MATVEAFARDLGGKITPLKHTMLATFEKRSAEAEFLLELDRRGYRWAQTRDGVVYAHFTDDPERLALYRKSAFPSLGTVVVQTNP